MIIPSRAKMHRVSLHKDTLLTFPELWMEVYVADGGDPSEEPRFAKAFMKGHCWKASSPETSDLVVFTGGDDVNPIYYDEERHSTTRSNTSRDMADMALYELCLQKGIPMLGICRGAQFLHVMNGGKLYQHVDGHTGDHPIYDIKAKRTIPKVSSVHHQMCIPNPEGGMEILADTHKTKERWRNPTVNDGKCGSKHGFDVEAFFYRDTCCLGIQGHPEYDGYDHFLQWTLQTIENYVTVNPDLTLLRTGSGVTSYRRIRPELVAQRDEAWLKVESSVSSDPDSDTVH